MTATPADRATASTQVTPQAAPTAPLGGEGRLPDGWEIAEYTGRGGRCVFAVYLNGRRMASGMPTMQSAVRWARLLISAA